MRAHVPVAVGNVVDYFPGEYDKLMAAPNGQPLAAIVVHVWSDWSINVSVFDAQGDLFARHAVMRYPPESPQPAGVPRWDWPVHSWPPSEWSP